MNADDILQDALKVKEAMDKVLLGAPPVVDDPELPDPDFPPPHLDPIELGDVAFWQVVADNPGTIHDKDSNVPF